MAAAPALEGRKTAPAADGSRGAGELQAPSSDTPRHPSHPWGHSYSASRHPVDRLLGVPQNFVSRYERARARPSAEYLAAVARLKNVSLDWRILGREPRRDVRGAHAGSGGDG
jgi:hypothetical protein